MAATPAKLPTILLVDQDPNTQKSVSQAFHQSGAFVLRYIADPKKTAAGLNKLRPDWLLVHAELDSFAMADVFKGLTSQPQFAAIPIVVLAKETGDQVWASQFRSGVVHVLKTPFDPARHVGEVRELVRSLSGRTGMVHGRGEPGELAALISHLKRAQRSGALTMDPASADAGSALFVRGAIMSASVKDKTGPAALDAISHATSDTWSFSELAGQAGDGAGIVIDVSGKDDDDDAIDLDVEVEVDPVEEVLSAPAITDDGAGVSPGGALSVLVVDDDPELLKMFSLILERRGMQVTTAHDGVEGHQKASEAPFDVVVADLSMPRMDGWGLLRQLRDDYRTRELPVAFLSCHDDYRESLRAVDAGAQAYLSKSVKHDVLAGQIRSLLKPRQQVVASLSEQGRAEFSVDAVGAQWLVQQLSGTKATGRLEAKDEWATYQVSLREGEVVGASVRAGQHGATGEPALIAFLGSRAATGSFSFGDPGGAGQAIGRTSDLIDRAVLTLNEKDRRAREAMLVQAKRMDINQPLYALYTQVGPKQWLHTAKLICEDRLAPAAVIAQSDASPIDVEETLKDLLRRGVVTLEP